MLTKLKQLLIGTRYLEEQWKRAVRLGWIKHFVEAAAAHCQGEFDAADLMGIASRETNLDPKWLTVAGDKGNGFGLMQADRRSFPEFTGTNAWKDARTGIHFGAKVLFLKYRDTLNSVRLGTLNRAVAVKTLSGKAYSFVPRDLTPAEVHRVSIAAYNCGRWAHYHISKGNDVDRGTAHGTYSRDVLGRAAFFRAKLKTWQEQQNAPIAPPETLAQSVPSGASAAQSSEPAAAQAADSNLSLKDFSRKYLRHTPADSIKNIFGVISARAIASGAFFWNLGVTGRVLLFLLVVALIAPALWAVYVYRVRLKAWAREIFAGFTEE